MNQEFIDQLAGKLQIIGTLHAVGETWISYDSSIPSGGIPFFGQTVDRTLWADLFAWASEQGKVKTETEWQEFASTHGGNCPFYSSGDGSTNFRMPKVVAYLKGVGTSAEGGSYKAQALPNAKGSFSQDLGTQYEPNGVFYRDGTVTSNATQGGGSSDELLRFSLSNDNPIYQDGADVTPETYGVIVGVYAVGIVSNVGGTELSNVITAITNAEETVNNVSNELANNLGNLAKLQSFFNGTFSKTLIFGGTDKANWKGSGEITLSKSWKNFDALLAFTTDDGKASQMYASIVWKWQLEWLIEMGVSSSKRYIAPWMHPAGFYYSFSPVNSTELLLTGPSENAGIQAIYGIKLQGTGVTNASAVDVSQIQARIAGMLTDDNHLILPSGLEVW